MLWRAARFYFWASDDPSVPKDQRSRWGKDGWDLAERAIADQPQRRRRLLLGGPVHGQLRHGPGRREGAVAGHGRQVPRPAGTGAGAEPGLRVEQRRHGVGRFYDKLPWPKRDRKKAEEHLRRAIELNPYALRARVYLALSYLDSGRAPEAKRLLDEVNAAVPGHYDPPEERAGQVDGGGRDAAAVREAGQVAAAGEARRAAVSAALLRPRPWLPRPSSPARPGRPSGPGRRAAAARSGRSRSRPRRGGRRGR